MDFQLEDIYRNRKYILLGDIDADKLMIYIADKSDVGMIQNLYHSVSEKYEGKWILLAIFVQDWNHELSPWKADAVFKNAAFGQGAQAFLEEIKALYTDLHNRYRLQIRHNCLSGYSLAGMFSLWATGQAEWFDSIAAISPSLWFSGLKEYLTSRQLSAKFLYMSLGDREAKTKNPVMATVGIHFEELSRYFGKLDLCLRCDWNEGNHFQDVENRIVKAMVWILQQWKEGI